MNPRNFSVIALTVLTACCLLIASPTAAEQGDMQVGVTYRF